MSFSWGTSHSINGFLAKKDFESVRKVARSSRDETHTIRVASLGDLSSFLKVSNDLLVHKSSKDLWKVEKTADGFQVTRLFDDEGKPIKA
jgi:hypothetical protein